jgi:hypothetical protein
MLASSITPVSPRGVLDRLRVDRITVLDDSMLPISGTADVNDRSVDLQWAIPAGFNIGPAQLFNRFAQHTGASPFNSFYFDGVMFHELGHARYLIDVYLYDVQDDGNTRTVDIREGSGRVVASRFMPMEQGGRVFRNPVDGLMNNTYDKIERVSAAALNLIFHHRATEGNYNAPGNLGVFLTDLPAHNRLTVRGQNGQALPGAVVSLYRGATDASCHCGRHYDNIPDAELTADAAGTVDLPQDPFPVVDTLTNGPGVTQTALRQAVLIVRVAYLGQVGYGFLPAYLFNLEYWAGHTEVGRYDLQVRLWPP